MSLRKVFYRVRRHIFDSNFSKKEYKKKYGHVIPKEYDMYEHYVKFGKSAKVKIMQAIKNSNIGYSDDIIKKYNIKIDIIICVHNAIDDVKKCISSIISNRTGSENIIIVDDNSDAETRDYLINVSTKENFTLKRNDVALGYTKAANVGLALSSADFVILLNSDTIVTYGWAHKMANAVFSLSKGGIVGPLSNAGGAQSVPNHIIGKAFEPAINVLHDGVTPAYMNQLAENFSQGETFPIVPMVHGFCFGITRNLINEIGLLDEEAFPKGYGEEDDYCMRANQAGFSHVIAIDTYVFHAKMKSYSNEVRIENSKQGFKKLCDRFGLKQMKYNFSLLSGNSILNRIRFLFLMEEDMRKQGNMN